MMLKSVLFTALAVISLPVAAKSVDWTPYLKGIQNGCDLQDIYANGVKYDRDGNPRVDDYDVSDLLGLGGQRPSGEEPMSGKKSKMPKALQPSVSKYQIKDGTVNVYLKNAVAFGQPIHRISYEVPWMAESFTIYFSNANFTKLKPQFYAIVDNKKYPIGKEKHWIAVFDEKTDETTYKSITAAQAKKLKAIGNGHIISITANGWSEEIEYYYGNKLTFDTKTKSIACESFSE